MAMQSVKRWQWIAASLVIGLAVGYVQHLPAPDWSKSFGDTIAQYQFEEGLLQRQDNLPWFRNIVVYPERIEVGGKSRPIYIVYGKYFNGRLETYKGRPSAIGRPRCYVAEVPYRPWGGVGRAGPGGTVLSFLDSLKSHGVTYTYAWWRDPKWGMSVWIGGSFLVIGLIWRTIINLLAFGSFFRPREPKGIDLSKVAASPGLSPANAAVTAQDMAAVEQLSSDLQSGLEADAPAAPAPGSPAAAHAPVQALAATSLESSAADQVSGEKAFGADEDDFYPTERKAHPHHGPDQQIP